MNFLITASVAVLALATPFTQTSEKEFEKWVVCNAAFTVGDLWTDDDALIEQNISNAVTAMEQAEKHGEALGLDFDEIYGRMNQEAEFLTDTGFDEDFEQAPELEALLKECRALIAAMGR